MTFSKAQILITNFENKHQISKSWKLWPPTLCNMPHWSYFTSSSSFLLLPLIHPPPTHRSPFLIPSSGKKKVPPGFLALKGQKQTGYWQPSHPLGSGYRRREEGGQAEGRESGERKNAVWDIFKARSEDGLRYDHLGEGMNKGRKGKNTRATRWLR